MKKSLTIIYPADVYNAPSPRLKSFLGSCFEGFDCTIIKKCEELEILLKNPKLGESLSSLLFLVPIGPSGINTTLYQMLQIIQLSAPKSLAGYVGGVIVDGASDLYTRSTAREILFITSLKHCTFPGKPLVEGTGSLTNFNTIARVTGAESLEGAYFSACLELLSRMMEFSTQKWKKPSILALHASNRETSNTLLYWNSIKSYLFGCDVREIHIENGTVVDCTGCSYTTCLHYAQQQNCFYGGVMVDEIYPAILACNVLVLLCPNYNDAISANLSAFINRLTALFRTQSFYDKYVYGVIVSGYSGSDILAQQIISGLNINKTFMLPPNFASMVTAHDPSSVLLSSHNTLAAKDFATDMKNTFLLP